MAEALRFVSPESVITGWDFSTGAVKCLAFDLHGAVLAEVRLPTDLWTEDGVSELSILQLEGQARASVRAMASRLRDLGRLNHWATGGISATHHTAGRVDRDHVPVRRAICWNDQSLAPYHARGVERLGGQEKICELIGGPWAERYTLSHLVKDEECLSREDWRRTDKILLHGPLAGGFLTGNFSDTSVSSAASTGIFDIRSGKWRQEMLHAIANQELRALAYRQLPTVVDHCQPLGQLSESLALEAGLGKEERPLIFPTSDDQQAGLVGGGAVDDGQMAIILGNSAVVNSSSANLPRTNQLDVMKLNWGPYLWMRCYTNGAQFLDLVVGKKPNWDELERQAREIEPGCAGTMVLPFTKAEPSIGVKAPRFAWLGGEPKTPGKKFRAALEALAYLVALGVRQHQEAGQTIRQITVSGGIARSELMCEILASVLGQPLKRLESHEGPALGAAVTALAALETYRRKEAAHAMPYTVSDGVAQMVRFRDSVQPNAGWQRIYEAELAKFEKALR